MCVEAAGVCATGFAALRAGVRHVQGHSRLSCQGGRHNTASSASLQVEGVCLAVEGVQLCAVTAPCLAGGL